MNPAVVFICSAVVTAISGIWLFGGQVNGGGVFVTLFIFLAAGLSAMSSGIAALLSLFSTDQTITPPYNPKPYGTADWASEDEIHTAAGGRRAASPSSNMIFKD